MSLLQRLAEVLVPVFFVWRWATGTVGANGPT